MKLPLLLAFVLQTSGLSAQTPTLVKDINPGTKSSNPEQITDLFGLVIFAAVHETYGWEMWRSDGTAAGTTLLRDISSSATTRPGVLGVAGRYLYFAHERTNFGVELWRTDGTTAGTVLVKDIRRGTESSYPFGYAVMGGNLYFTAFELTNGRELWRTDGTTSGTVLVADILEGDGGSNPGDMTALQGQVYFRANDGKLGYELWRTDGTRKGTQLVKDIDPVVNASSSPTEIFVFEGNLYFRATDGKSGLELWRSDGTETGTWRVRDIRSGSGSSYPMNFTVLGDQILFAANGELWITDGTNVGTKLLRDIRSRNSSSPSSFVRVGERIFFYAYHDTFGRELWRTDGTYNGTVMVKDLAVGGSSSSFTMNLIAAGSRHLWFFRAQQNVPFKLWRSDGSSAGTTALGGPEPLSSVGNLTLSSGKIFFAAGNPTVGAELWVIEPHATAKSFGEGCGSPIPPTLDAIDPVLGQRLDIETNSEQKNAVAVGIFGFPAVRPSPLSTACTAYSVLAASMTVPFRTDANGRFVQSFPIPNNAALIGVTVVAQSAIANTKVPPLGLELTNGVFLRLGR